MSVPSLSSRKAISFLLCGAVAIGLAPIFARLAVTQGGVGSIAAGFWRMFLGAIGFGLMGLRIKTQREQFRSSLKSVFDQGLLAATAAGVLFACDLIAWHISFEYTSVANSTLLANLSSLLVPTAGVLIFGEVLRRSLVVGGFFAISGAVLLILNGTSPAGASHSEFKYLGDALAFLTAFFYAGYMLSTKSLAKKLPPRALMLVISTVSAVILLIASVVLHSQIIPTTLIGWLWIFCLGLFPQILGQGFVAIALTQLPVSISALMLLLAPVSTAFFGFLVLDQHLQAGQIGGVILTLIGIAIVGSRR